MTFVLPRYADDTAGQPSLDHPDYRSTALRHPTQPLVVLPQR